MKPVVQRVYYVMQVGGVRDHVLSAHLSKVHRERRVHDADVLVLTAGTYCGIRGAVKTQPSVLDMVQKVENC